MSQLAPGSLHKFLTGETVTGDDTQVATNLNIPFELLRLAHNDTDTRAKDTYTKSESDARYYTKTQLDAGQLDTRYYTESELNAGQLDNRYYTETELNAGQLNNLYYTESELNAGQLDSRYYNKTQLDAGQLDSRYYTEAEIDAAFGGVAPDGQMFSTKAQTFIATEGQTDFTLTAGSYVLGQSRIQVSVAGVLQYLGSGDFSELSTTSFRLSEGVPVGTKVEATWLQGMIASPSDDYRATLPPTPVSLVNGMQVFNNAQASPLANVTIKGRTLVNLLGRDGNCEDVSKWTGVSASVALDATNKVYGSNGLKVTISAAQGVANSANLIPLLSASKSYLFVAEAKNGNATNALLYFSNTGGTLAGVPTNNITSTSTFGVTYSLLDSAQLTGMTSLKVSLVVNGANTQYSYFDGVRVYEITSAEKTYITGLSTAAAQTYIATKYPYVDDVKPVNAPYVIKYGENLAPMFSEWTSNGSGSYEIPTPYNLKITATLAGYGREVKIPVVASQSYKLTVNVPDGGFVSLYRVNADGSQGTFYIDSSIQPAVNGVVTLPFTAASDATLVYLSLTSGASTGTFNFSNPMLVLGSTAKAHKPRNDDTLFFPNASLHGSVDGTVYDQVFKRDGKWFVERRFKDVILDGSLTWVFASDFTGYKAVTTSGIAKDRNTNVQPIGTKYDGKILSYGTSTASDQIGQAGWTDTVNYNVTFSIADTDSGWGESYTPSAAEIAAFMNGWTMHDESNVNLPYTTGNKRWRKSTSVIAAGNGTFGIDYGVSTLPTTAVMGFKNYKLTYQLASSTFEEIPVDAGMSLHEGLNQLEVGQGIQVREKANPKSNGINYFIGSSTLGSALNKRINFLLSVYKNGVKDGNWSTYADDGTGYGKIIMKCPVANFDPTATYEVSYIALDQYLLSAPVQTINGEVASNLKTVVDALAANDADQDARISAAELLAGQIYNVPKKTLAAITLYVDATNGADNNDGSAGKPFKTIQRAVNSQPQMVNHSINIYVAAGTYAETVSIKGFSGSSTISILGGTDNTTAVNFLVTAFYVQGNTNSIVIRGFKATSDSTDTFFVTNNSGYVKFDSCVSTTAYTNFAAGFNVSSGGTVYIASCIISNRYSGIYSFASNVASNSNTGTNNVYGLRSDHDGSITKSGTQPTGTTPEYTANGTITNGVLNPWGDNTYSTRSGADINMTATQTLSLASVWYKLVMNAKANDNLTEYDAVTNYRFTAKSSGRYKISASIGFTGLALGTRTVCALYKNGNQFTSIAEGGYSPSGTSTIHGGCEITLLAGDYIEFYVLTTTTSAVVDNTSTSTNANITKIA